LWFEDLQITHDEVEDESLLCGTILDQAALYGILVKQRDLGLALLGVKVDLNSIEKEGAAPP
jgi:hypothetical protein